MPFTNVDSDKVKPKKIMGCLMKIIVKGIVQGVGFRPTVARIARSLGLKGYVKNAGAYVEIFVDRDHEKFIEILMKNIPPNAKIDSIQIFEENGEFDDFKIIESSPGKKSWEFPPDISICDDCVKDLFDRKNRRYLYPFTNCAICGPRFSILIDLPYDRENTTMKNFPMCLSCKNEFENIDDRRFNAQTISCKECGPHYSLYDRNGIKIEIDDPIKEYAKLIDEGYFGVAKGWGGMHISCIPEKVNEFRNWYGRPKKPFAIMVKDIETAEKYSYVNDFERSLLVSSSRPIVLLKKKNVEEGIAPGLPYVGIYLPYSAFHYILFHYLKHDAIINTSANIPGEPMITKNSDVFSLNADFYLIHNLEIFHRTDDSVLKTWKNRTLFIRKSRGYVPDIIKVPYKERILSLGAHTNARISISRDNLIFSSQYLGDLSSYNYLKFFEEMVKEFMRILELDEIDAIVMDKHPGYGYRKIVEKFSSITNNVIEVQHHHAHASSLCFDNSLESIIAFTFDGTGYGDDGQLWGGELLFTDIFNYKRLASLEYIPLPGNENAIKDPSRILAYLFSIYGKTYKNYDPKTIRIVGDKSIKSSSFGRVLDAISNYLGFSDKMTYEGEPAMMLELPLMKGKKLFDFPKSVEKGDRIIIKTKDMFKALFEMNGKPEDLAYSFVYDLLDIYTDIAVEFAESYGTKIGISGGVAYSIPILDILENLIEKKYGDELITHSKIPPGDAGISVGQNIIGSMIYSKS